MAVLWCASLSSLLEAQARPVVAEEAKAYQQHGHKNAKDRAWWELRCMVRSLAVFCADEEMAEVMVSSGLLQFLKALTNSQTSHFKALGSNQGILIKKRNLQASSSHIQNGSSLLDHFLKASFNGSN